LLLIANRQTLFRGKIPNKIIGHPVLERAYGEKKMIPKPGERCKLACIF
jgi:hypothetical protein